MDIVIIANFPLSLSGGAKGRFLYLGEMLAGRGHCVEMIVSDFDHTSKKHRVKDSVNQDCFKTKITLLHESGYKNNVSLKRLWSHFNWGRNVARYLRKIDKPDLIYCAVPSLTAARVAAKFCKKNQIKFAIDLQDLWPEAFAMVSNNRFFKNALLPMKWYIDKAYSSADIAIAVSNTYVERILSVNKKIRSGLSVFLGSDGEAFDNGRAKYHLKRVDDEIVVGYIGNMSTSYDIPCVIDALAIVKRQGKVDKPIRFVLIGGGVDEDKFQEYAKKAYSNTCFLGKRSYSEMAGMLCDCDIVVNPIVKGSAASIINKVGDYALAGLPVINTQESEEYRQLIEDYQCGINCHVGNALDVANAIEQLSNDESLRIQMGKNARKLGEERFDRRNTYRNIVQLLESA